MGLIYPKNGKKQLSKGQDTLDVWIDSGCSHRAVLRVSDKISGLRTCTWKEVISTEVGFRVLYGPV